MQNRKLNGNPKPEPTFLFLQTSFLADPMAAQAVV